MDIYGERYAEVSLFIDYCRNLNVKTDERELEYYEKTDVMLPVARVVYPSEFIVQLDRHEQEGNLNWEGFDEWPALADLTDRWRPSLRSYDDLTDEDLVHCFDRAIHAGGNRYLCLPSSGRFRPWDEYAVSFTDVHGNELERNTAKHYYNYWQVHQLYRIQQHPHLYRYAGLVDRLPPGDPVRASLLDRPHRESLRDFEGMKRNFDALSFWITLYGRERSRVLAGIPEGYSNQHRLSELASMTAKRCQLTEDGLFQFLGWLIWLYQDYEGHERHKLARALRSDILHCSGLLELMTYQTRDQIADRLGRADPFDKQTFRHLLPAYKERDYALRILTIPAPDWTRAWQEDGDSDWSFTDADANSLLDYCEGQGLPLLRTGLSGMEAVGAEERVQKFGDMQGYTNLRNVLHGYEDLLKKLGVSANRTQGRSTLTSTVGQVMYDRGWTVIFHRICKDPGKLLSGGSDTEFHGNLLTLLTHGDLEGSAEGSMARAFLVTCLARNLTAHINPDEPLFFADAFGKMLDAAVTAITYTWKLAQKQGWAGPSR